MWRNYVAADDASQIKALLPKLDLSNQEPKNKAPKIKKLGKRYIPKPMTTWHWQLQGPIKYSVAAQVYDIDLFDVPIQTISELQAKGVRIICYFSAGSYEPYRPDADAFHPDDLGKTMKGWPQEKWLDIRSERVLAIMHKRIQLAKTKGCDGVEPDNVDGFENDTGFPLLPEVQLNFNRSLASMAHALNLSIGLKNNVNQAEALVDFYDFAVNEECDYYQECDRLSVFTAQNKAVFHVEYQETLVSDALKREALCRRSNTMKFSTLVLPLALDHSFRLSCL